MGIKKNCALKLDDEIILYYDARSKKHQITVPYRFPCLFSGVRFGEDANVSCLSQMESFLCFATSRSQWPRGLRRRSTAVRLLKSWVRIPPVAWMSVCCECCVLSGRGLCDELTTHPEESYRLWWVVVCDIETSSMRSQISVNCD